MPTKQLSLMEEVVPSKKIKPKYAKPYEYDHKELVMRVLLCGMGTQSITLAYMAALGIIDVDLILFSDTGLESKLTLIYEEEVFAPEMERAQMSYYRLYRTQYVQWARMAPGFIARRKEYGIRYSFPFWTSGEISPVDEHGFVTEYIRKDDNKKPGRLSRQCTQEAKIYGNTRMLRRQLLDMGHANMTRDGRILINKDVYIETIYGITTDERIRATAKGTNKTPRSNSWQKATYPLLDMDMSRDDCIRWLMQNDYEVPAKSACFMCPYRNDASWLAMKEMEYPYDDVFHIPGDFTAACNFERMMNNRKWRKGTALEKVSSDVFLHQACVPLAEADFTPQNDKPYSLFEDELIDTCRTDGGFVCGLWL